MMDEDNPHGPQPGPAVQLVSLDTSSIPSSRRGAKTLQPNVLLSSARHLAAGWWREGLGTVPHGNALTARALGVTPSAVSRLALGQDALHLAHVVVAPAKVRGTVLLRLQEHADGVVGASPAALRARLLSEAIEACSEAAQLAARLEKTPLEAMTDEALDKLIAWIDSLLGRLGWVGRRLRDEQARRRRERERG
jgi:hypothetical protein